MTDSIQLINEYLDALFAGGPWIVYGVVFVACFIENIIPPFPGDSFIVGAGALVGLSRLHMAPTLISIVTGGMLSVTMLYFVGRNQGRVFFLKRNFKYFSVEDIGVVEHRLKRWGAWILILSRFVVGFRSALALGAGIGRYPVGRMLAYSTISYLIFSALLLYAAVKLVEHLEQIQHYFTLYNSIVWPVLILGVGLFVWRRWRSGSVGREETRK